VRASSCNNASLARPLSAGAVTDALMTRPPSTAAMASSRSAFARGDSRIATRRPSRVTVKGPSDKIFEHQIAKKPQQQNEDHRRDVDPAQIWEKAADRAQQGLGDTPQEVPDHGNDAVVPVDDAKRDEPAEDRLGDQQPDVDCDDRVEK